MRRDAIREMLGWFVLLPVFCLGWAARSWIGVLR